MTCCHINCPEEADFEIYLPPDPYNVTQACETHVGALLGYPMNDPYEPGRPFTVVPVDSQRRGGV